MAQEETLQGHAISSRSRTQGGDRPVVRETQARNVAVRVRAEGAFPGGGTEKFLAKSDEVLLIGKRFEGSPTTRLPQTKETRACGVSPWGRGKEATFPFHYGKGGRHGWPLQETPLS